MKEKKSITLQFSNYVITGIAYITLWGGEKGFIEMKSYNVDDLTDDFIKKGANDNGYGCQSIDKIEIDIYENYEGYLVYLESKEIEM
jgi:hypothetical protein